MPSGATQPTCPHCHSAVPDGCREAPFCCRGCREVADLLKDQGLGRYYDLAQGDVLPAQPPVDGRSQAWLEPLLEKAAATPGGVCRLELDVQGIHCAACVWLMDELFRRQTAGGAIRVNPSLGKVEFAWHRDKFDLGAWVRQVERFGYRFGPSRKGASLASHDLLMRIGVCAALDMGVMMFSIPFYLGLSPDEGVTFRLFGILNAVLSVLVVAVGGWPFIRSGLQAMRQGLSHLDLPIAIGMLLALGASLVKFQDGRGDQAYFEAVSGFTTLMLVGRWLQERLIERNRRYLLEEAGTDLLQTRRERDGRLEVVSVSQVAEGDVIVVAPGDLVPVDGVVLDAPADVSTDWINGESAPLHLAVGSAAPAGGFNAGRRAVRLRAATAFSASPLPRLLRAVSRPAALARRLVDAVARYYVPVVILLAILGLALWWGDGYAKALDVTVALLVVTCPCAVGIAVPLAHELALARLRRAGVLVRSEDLLPRALDVRQVLFDKTGTLTLGRLELVEPRLVVDLPTVARDAMYDMASRSNHPVSKCLSDELARGQARFCANAAVVETPGAGLELTRDGHVWRLGRPGWAAPAAPREGLVVLGLDGACVAEFALRESVRADARTEVRELRDAGYDVWLVSGDAPAKVARLAEALAIPGNRALGAQSPEDKAATVVRVGAATSLFVGDGVNDSLAFAAAHATASPAADRPVMPGKADFFLVGESIGGVRALLSTAHVLHRLERWLLWLALVYNVGAVGLCLAGTMTPLRAAVAMPVSSLVLIVLVGTVLGRRAPAPAARPADLPLVTSEVLS